MLNRITSKMQLLNELKVEKVPETIKRVVNKDKEGHVVKYLARRLLQFPVGIGCDLCKVRSQSEEHTKELDFYSCHECQYDICKECRLKDVSEDPICIENEHFCKFLEKRSGYYCSFCGESKEEGMWTCEQDDCLYDACNDCL